VALELLISILYLESIPTGDFKEALIAVRDARRTLAGGRPRAIGRLRPEEDQRRS
jgi:hypothetical protein